MAISACSTPTQRTAGCGGTTIPTRSNALGALDAPKTGDVWFTARPGCEFEVPGGAAHVGGASHGGLHALESLCPFVIAGPAKVDLPRHMRSVDIAPLCLELLGVPAPFRVGEPRP